MLSIYIYSSVLLICSLITCFKLEIGLTQLPAPFFVQGCSGGKCSPTGLVSAVRTHRKLQVSKTAHSILWQSDAHDRVWAKWLISVFKITASSKYCQVCFVWVVFLLLSR